MHQPVGVYAYSFRIAHADTCEALDIDDDFWYGVINTLLTFFHTGVSPVAAADTLALMATKDAFYQKWIALDPAERERYEQRLQEEAKAEEAKRAAAASTSSNDSYISTMAAIYAREKKENEEYLKRLHEWATDGDDPTPGCGDGI